MTDDPLEELPPEMAAAWRALEAQDLTHDDEQVPTPPSEAKAEPAGPRPSDAPPSSSSSSPVRGFVVLPIVVAVVLAARLLGVAGWRGGGAGVTAALVAVTVIAGLLLTRGLHLRAAYVAGGLVLALVGSAWCVSTAPLSHGRLEQVLDDVPSSGLTLVGTVRRGHGWCRPRCPTVTRTYVVAGRPPVPAMQAAVVAIDVAGLIPRDADRVAYSRVFASATAALPVSIDNQRYTTVLRVVADPSPRAVGGSRVSLEVTSRPGVRTRPLTPARAR